MNYGVGFLFSIYFHGRCSTVDVTHSSFLLQEPTTPLPSPQQKELPEVVKPENNPKKSQIFNPFLSTALMGNPQQSPEKSPEIPKEVNSPLNLSKPRKEEPNNNNNKTELEKHHFGTYDEDLANFELLRKRKYFLDQNKSFPAVSPPQLFPHNPTLSPKLPPHPYLSGNEFPYPPFRSFPGFENRSAVAATAAAVGMLPPMGQPAAAAGLAALRNSASLGLHQVSMIDQVRHEHQRQQQQLQQQQQQQQQQTQQQSEDGLNCTRKLYNSTVINLAGLNHPKHGV